MPGPLLAAGIAAGAQLLGTASNMFATSKINRDTQIWNQQMYDRQRADRLSYWNMQNAYDDPSAQMDRLSRAGLNPNLVYGNGGNAAGSSSPLPPTNMGAYTPQAPDMSGIGRAAEEGFRAYQATAVFDEQVKNMQAQRNLTEVEALNKVADLAGKDLKNAQNRELYDTVIAIQNEKLYGLQVDTDVKVSQEVRNAAMHAPTLDAAFGKVAKLAVDTKVAEAQLANLRKTGQLQQLEINMRKLGLSYNDGVILRVLAQFAGGQSLPELVNNLWNKVKALSKSAQGKYRDTTTTVPK